MGLGRGGDRVGHPTSNLTYNGVLWYDNGTILGDGRIFSTDYWGGYLIYNECVSFKGEGSGSCVLDETGLVMVNGEVVTGDYDANGVVIHVIGGGSERVSLDLAALAKALGL